MMFGFRTMVSAAWLASAAHGFYIPGGRPQEFKKGALVQMKVNAMTSMHTQIPKDYYHLPFCAPEGGPKMAAQNLGEFLTGNKIQSSPYSINMLTETFCQKLCQISMTKLEAAKMKLHIKYGYHNNWILDDLPSAAIGRSAATGEKLKHYAGGFSIGFIASNTKQSYIFNHVNIIIDYHQWDPAVETYRVVGFAIEPMSVAHEFQGGYEWDGISEEGLANPLSTCDPTTHMERSRILKNQLLEPDTKILFTYDVIWKRSDVTWSSRWDIYLSEDHLVPPLVHWHSITESILVVLFLSHFMICVLVRNLRRDIAAYNALAALTDEEKDDAMDESWWRLVHEDVFRPPSNMPMMYCVCIGGGAQLAITILFVILFSAIGFLSQARRGSLLNAILVFYMLSGIVAGYVSSRLYKAFKGHLWRLCTVVTALLFPGIAFCLFLFFNIILWFVHSTASAPLLDVIIVAAMWCCVSIPLVFLGAHIGYKAESNEFPTVTSTIARAIPPPQPLLFHPTVGMLVAGVAPFYAANVELIYIMTSLWMNQYYDVFGFTLIVYLILIITCAEVTVILVYYQLRAENHRWWWFSFFAPGSTALYTFIYSIFWFQSLESSRLITTYLLYFGYMGLICSSMLLVTGTTGSLTSLWFVHKIFGTINVDYKSSPASSSSGSDRTPSS